MKKAAMIVAAIGGVALIFAVVFFIMQYKTKDWPEVDGTVTNVQDAGYAASSSNNVKKKNYKVSVEYTIDAQQGLKQYTTLNPPAEGATVPVRYNPNNNSEVSVGEFGTSVIAASIVGGVGLVLLLAGGGYALYQRRSQTKS